jgi:hypothetical protein
MENKLEKFSRLVIGTQDNESITDTNKEINLETNREDMMALFVKGIFGIVPFGSPIVEAITTVIPNQKLERLVDFVQILNYKIKNAERKIEDHELKTEEFTDLLEDALGQASRALSKERLEYIASLLKNSLTDEELEHFGKKKLLSLLNELNDAEVIWLRSYAFKIRHTMSEDYKQYFETHKKVLQPYNPSMRYLNVPQEIINKDAIMQSYINNLLKLNLIKEKFEKRRDGRRLKFDEKTGKIKSSDIYCSSLGEMLLKYIDLDDSKKS